MYLRLRLEKDEPICRKLGMLLPQNQEKILER
jgi:hypothetical protein